MDKYIAQVKKGYSFIVMRKSEVVFLISPLNSEDIELIKRQLRRSTF